MGLNVRPWHLELQNWNETTDNFQVMLPKGRLCWDILMIPEKVGAYIYDPLQTIDYMDVQMVVFQLKCFSRRVQTPMRFPAVNQGLE